MKIAGATVFRGLEGYGESAEMHKSHLARHDQPILISIVDSAENVSRLVPVVEEMMDTGLMAVSDVEWFGCRSTQQAHPTCKERHASDRAGLNSRRHSRAREKSRTSCLPDSIVLI